MVDHVSCCNSSSKLPQERAPKVRYSGSRITLTAAPSHSAWNSGICAAFVPGYSSGTATDLHRASLDQRAQRNLCRVTSFPANNPWPVEKQMRGFHRGKSTGGGQPGHGIMTGRRTLRVRRPMPRPVRESSHCAYTRGQVFWLPNHPTGRAFPSLEQWRIAAFVIGYSSASATDSHRLPLAHAQWFNW